MRPGAANIRRFTFPLPPGTEEYKKRRTENEQTAKFQKCLISTRGQTDNYTQHRHSQPLESLIIVVCFYIIASLRGTFP